ncbi:hypothetical protein [Guptibacillus hwajinpoensis]|uniref:Uncharacterized protein n=1 Tax=Guptibacillus hwajinpoensis TaxID=208199 RepID=A0A0J6FX83_9BACL|nr:hypothetical protein [Alkalihalobacillus macyae]KMM38977.1 hypothetical protein AB986_06955 [Alkalihalobacillus macyae]
MHTKHTVRYICERYPSGNHYYYKQELITHDSWQNPLSIQWSARRPISSRTFIKKEKEGYKTINTFIEKQPADILMFSKA